MADAAKRYCIQPTAMKSIPTSRATLVQPAGGRTGWHGGNAAKKRHLYRLYIEAVSVRVLDAVAGKALAATSQVCCTIFATMAIACYDICTVPFPQGS